MSSRPAQIYCFDTSAFVTLSRTHESVIKIPAALWKRIEEMMTRGEIVSHELVFNEIYSESVERDFIANWISDKREFFHHRTVSQEQIVPGIIVKFPGLIDAMQEKEQADPWLIAQAIEISRDPTLFGKRLAAVVSQENPTSSKKIPAVCKHFDVEHLSLRNFFDRLRVGTELVAA